MCQSFHLLLLYILSICQKKENSAVTSSMDHQHMPETLLHGSHPQLGQSTPEEMNKPQEGPGPQPWWQCPPEPWCSGVYPQHGRRRSKLRKVDTGLVSFEEDGEMLL